MSSGIYNSAKADRLNAAFSLASTTIKGMLLKSTYAADFDLHTRRSDLTAFEVSGTNYTAGGGTLTGKTVSQDNPNDRAVWDATDMLTQWINTTLTGANAPRYVAFYHSTGVAANDELICCFDFGANQPTTAQDFNILFDPVGIITAT